AAEEVAKKAEDARLASIKAASEAVKAATETAKKVEEVKTTLEDNTIKTTESLDNLTKLGRDTHTLVNSNMAVQLKLNMELSQWKADQLKKEQNVSSEAVNAEKEAQK